MGLKPTDAKERIINVMISICAQEGVEALTLEKVAKASGLTKPGVLYYFKNKEELLIGLTEHVIDKWLGDIEEKSKKDKNKVGNFCRAYLETQLEDDLNKAWQSAFRYLLTKVPRPDVIQKQQEKLYSSIYKRLLSDGIPPENALTIFLCSDALCFNEVFGLPKPPKAALSKMLKNLHQLTKERSL